ncbi:hypothetical protein DIPPA_12783 [Diplonema papillatum]|nr:hypothetical protein DIPPA_12783 [Diplonema papillatum]
MSEACPAKPVDEPPVVASLETLDYSTSQLTFTLDGTEYAVHACPDAPVCPAYKMVVTVASSLPLDHWAAALVPGEETLVDPSNSDAVVRTMQYPMCLQPLVYNLAKAVINVDASTRVVTHHTDLTQPQQHPGLFMNERVEIREEPAGNVTLTLHQQEKIPFINSSGQDDAKMLSNWGFFFCHRVHCLLVGKDPLMGKLKEIGGEDIMPSFAAACDNKTDFVLSKVHNHISGVHGPVEVYRHVGPRQNVYPAWRLEWEMQGSVDLFFQMLNALSEGAYVQKAITPECEVQEIIHVDPFARGVRKVDKYAPWPFKKREFILMSVLAFEPSGGVYLAQRSYEDDNTPQLPADCVRGRFHAHGFRCLPSATPGHVRVVQIVDIDPTGLPIALYEIAGLDKLFKMVSRMAKVLQEPEKWT